MAVTVQDLKNMEQFKELDEAVLTEALATVDQEAIKAEEEARFTWLEWDRTTPINGVSAEDVLANRNDIPDGGHIYMITIDGQIGYFQPFIPEVAGYQPITAEQLPILAQSQLEKIAYGYVFQRVITGVQEALPKEEA